MPLNVIVVGAGIAGLAAAVGFARHGHHVQVFERRTSSDREQSGSGIGLQPNVENILRRWNLLSQLEKVAHDTEMVDLRDQTGISITKKRNQGHAYWCLRRVMKELMREAAIDLGVEIFEGTKLIQIEPQVPAIILENGQKISADLIIAADGANSKIRRLLWPQLNSSTLLPKAVFQIQLPLDLVQNDPILRTLMDGPKHSIIVASPRRNIVSSPAPYQNLFDLQFGDAEYTIEKDPHPDIPNETIPDLTWLRERFSDHSEGIRKALHIATSAFKWRFREVNPDLPSWSTSNGRIVLLGDAAHAMTWYSGQGTAMGLEDAVVLSELFASSTSTPPEEIALKVRLYETMRRPRCDLVRRYAAIIGQSWTEKSPEKIDRRNRTWEKLWSDPNVSNTKADSSAPFGSAEFETWLDKYDVFDVVEKEIMARKRAYSKI